MQHTSFMAYQEHTKRVLRELVGVPVTAKWWNKQTLQDGNHRTWLHYNMGLNFNESARELQPFAEAQLVNPLPTSEHWKECCSEWSTEHVQK